MARTYIFKNYHFCYLYKGISSGVSGPYGWIAVTLTNFTFTNELGELVMLKQLVNFIFFNYYWIKDIAGC